MNAIANFFGYQITEQVYAGTRTLVYRGIRTSDQYPVVIKLLRNEYPNFNELVGFRNQYTIAKNLDLPSIIKPLTLEAYHNSYALVMEDFGGVSLSSYLKAETEAKQPCNSLSLEDFLNLALQLTDILDYLYQNRVIHKDIKPANILIHPETKTIKLIDFSIASLLPRETQEIQNANALEGTLAYLSPEQTGRMNRGIDYRSDFYSLGVTFYELLTKQLPFGSDDPMELVHCHLAKQSIPIHQVNPEIPLILSEIVSKLMAKNAENRYQSALGLKHDLENCLAQLQETGKIEYFELGKRDITDRFLIPEKLYGRETEVETLLQAFERVSLGATEMMLVAGFSGIGKTAVVNEVHKPIVRQRGYFIKGKYDQFQRNIPFSAFVQAFRDLMGQLLCESDAQLQIWKTKILEAAGDNGQVLIDVIPELELIIGRQPAATELSGTAAQNRFNLLIQKFIKVFASQAHPLVMFVDDLQWADSASLNLLKLLMQDTKYLLILGAYRDNEVSPAHPFMLTVDEIIKTGATVKTITLEPLSLLDLNQLVADTLGCELSLAQPLTELVYQKTQGNPFFATQFLKALHEDKQITFDWDIRHWQCDLAKVKALALTDDVVEFMALQLQKLPTQTQDVLKLAACIGAQFDLNTLAIVLEKSTEDVAIVLWKALQEGLIIPNTEVYKFFMQSDSVLVFDATANPTYRFLHDRAQQAAYSLISQERRNNLHLAIGRLLVSNTIFADRDENIFAIVNHFNQGIVLIADPREREKIAHLNLKAGQKANAATAYSDAVTYLRAGQGLLADNAWQSQYQLALEIANQLALATCLSGDFQKMEETISLVIVNARSLHDRVTVYETRLQALVIQDRALEAVQSSLDFVEKLGIKFPKHPQNPQIFLSLFETKLALFGKSIQSLENLPAMQDVDKIAAIKILSKMLSSCYIAKPNLLPILVFRMIKMFAQHGNSSLSAFIYIWYGLIMCGVVQDIDTGYEFGQLAVKIVDKFDAKEVRAKVVFGVYNFVSNWKIHIRDTIAPLLQSYQIGLETGDIEYGSWAIFAHCMNSYFIGNHLSEVEQNFQIYSESIAKLNQDAAFLYMQIFNQTVQNLLGQSANAAELAGKLYCLVEMEEKQQEDANKTGLLFAYTNQGILYYLFDRIPQAASAIQKGREVWAAGMAMYIQGLFCFYESLIYLADISQDKLLPSKKRLHQVKKNQRQIQKWASYAPMNFQHKWDLVEAERRRVSDNKLEAITYYDRAISGAKVNGYVNEEALANELTGKFYLDWGKERIAAGYMQEAYYCYARWGAKAKVVDLETRYPQLLGPILQQPQTSFNPLETLSDITHSFTQTDRTTISDALDFTSVLQAAQVLSSTIQLDELLKQLVQIILQNSGGSKCVLVLPQNETWLLRAISTPEVTKLCSEPLDGHSDVPIKLIQYVKRTKSVVVIDNLQTDLPVIDDYLTQQQPLSILCLPILNQGHLAGILYLKNQSTAGVFTSARLTVIEFLCTQAAISLENARLYQESQHYAQQLERSLHSLQQAQEKIQETEKLFQTMADSAPVFLWLAGTDTLCYFFNQTWLDFTGRTMAQEMGNGWAEGVHPEDFQSCLDTYLTAFHARETFKMEYRLKRADGEYRWILDNGTPRFFPDGSFAGYVGSCIDISDRKRAEAGIIQKSRELSQALQNLQQTQLQMIQSEKMSALGNLVAGVAHEINNPVGFISGNLTEAKIALADLIEHMNLYNSQASIAELENHAEEIDLEYLLEDLPKMIDSMKQGCDRIKGISTSLRTFSRADTYRPVACNIHDGIDSTIMILKHRLKANGNRPEIAVIKEYRDLPQVECYAGQLNQVFMNLLGNAIDALDESNIGRSYQEIANQITIKTELSPNKQVVIRIQDNGKGMTEEVKEKIFDHLFTTKAVGKGTGLGLAIARQIVVEKHSGLIYVNSLLGAGTEFIITLPIKAEQTS